MQVCKIIKISSQLLWFILFNFSVVSFLISSVISALLTVALTAVAAVDLGSMYKCPKNDYRLSYSPKYCGKSRIIMEKFGFTINSFAKHFSGPYFATRIIQAGWGLVIVSIIQLIASSCSVFICIRLIYRKESSMESAVRHWFFIETSDCEFILKMLFSAIGSIPVWWNPLAFTVKIPWDPKWGSGKSCSFPKVFVQLEFNIASQKK